jgi:hypothetical protein
MDPDPELIFLIVVSAEPLVEALGSLELAYLFGVDDNRYHLPDHIIDLWNQESVELPGPRADRYGFDPTRSFVSVDYRVSRDDLPAQ